jgi:hypothetical protein
MHLYKVNITFNNGVKCLGSGLEFDFGLPHIYLPAHWRLFPARIWANVSHCKKCKQLSVLL